ncbi:MAG: glycosyltransferase [Alphaproteobacteria bacterium]|nr:glycosyltransferase [Alphaproteobacteria bacterium]
MSGRRLKLAVLVDLERRPSAGGHVKCWERFAEAATRRDDLDLTVHVQGAQEGVEALSSHVRFMAHRPVFSTARLSWLLGKIPDHTDLSPWHPAIAQALPNYDVVHTTDAFFAMARTALRVCQSKGIPLVNSVHTDTPGYSRLYTRSTILRFFGKGALADLLLNRLKIDRQQDMRMHDRLRTHQKVALFSLDSDPLALEEMKRFLGEGRVGVLRRGIDKRFFHPGKRDRLWLKDRFGIPYERPVVFFAGRIDQTKNILIAARAVAELIGRGQDVHFLAAGKGDQASLIREILKDRASLPGSLPLEEMGRLYASADVFAFPSMLDVLSNALMEALASGLPVLVGAGSGLEAYVASGANGAVVSDEGWADALQGLLENALSRQEMGLAARFYAERALPSWDDVLAQDLMPLWRRAARWE